MTRRLALAALIAGSTALAGCDDMNTAGTMEAGRAASPAETACLAAVASETGVDDVSIASVSDSQAGTSVMVSVAGAQAPWNCAVDTDGVSVVNVFFTGSEGAL